MRILQLWGYISNFIACKVHTENNFCLTKGDICQRKQISVRDTSVRNRPFIPKTCTVRIGGKRLCTVQESSWQQGVYCEN